MNWKHLFATREKNAPLQFPFQQEIVPGELRAIIHSHSIPTAGSERPCWSYVTEGLARHKQREVIFTLVRQDGEAPESYPRGPLELFRTLLGLSKQGRSVGPGGLTSLAGEGLLGFHGFTYVEPVWVPPGGPPTGNWLAMIGLTADEVGILRGFGSTRVLSMLGKAAGLYPAPYWSERNRVVRLALESMEASFVATVPHVADSGFSVYREGSRIALRAYAAAAGETVKALRSRSIDSPLVLLTRIHPGADGALVWAPGENQAEAVVPAGSLGQRLCGSFVLFLPGQQADAQQLMEDGYLLRLTAKSWGRLRDAILSQEDIQTSLFELAWIPYGFEECLPMRPPAAAVPPPAGSVFSRRIELLQSSGETSAAITMDALVAFQKTVEDAVRNRFSHDSAKGGLRVTIEIQPGARASYHVATQGNADSAALQRLWDDLQKLTPPDAKKPVGFAVEFEI